MDEGISQIKRRILQYIEYKNITKLFFCEKTGISYGNMRGKSLNSELGGAQIAEFLNTFDDISADWLLTGKGEMLKSQQNLADINNASNTKDSDIHINGNLTKLLDIIKQQQEHVDKLIETIRLVSFPPSPSSPLPPSSPNEEGAEGVSETA